MPATSPTSHHEVNAFRKTRQQFIRALLDDWSARFPNEQLLESGAVLNPATKSDDERATDKEVIQLSHLFHADSRVPQKHNQHSPPRDSILHSLDQFS